jgi:hypothetical protein
MRGEQLIQRMTIKVSKRKRGGDFFAMKFKF